MPVNSVANPVNPISTVVAGVLSTTRAYFGLQPSLNAASYLQHGEFVDPCRFRFSGNFGGRTAA